MGWQERDDPGQTDSSRWRIKDIYEYLGAMGDELSPEEAGMYCRFIIDCQDSNTGDFTDRYGEFVYSVNALINAVEAQRGNKISDADADALINSALGIIGLLE